MIYPNKSPRRLKVSWLLLGAVLLIASCTRPSKPGAPPNEHRFKKVVLTKALTSPGILDFDGHNRIFIVDMVDNYELGNIKIFDQQSGALTTAARLPTFSGGEFGIIGMCLDPHFDENGFIYLHYFPKESARIERISRFHMSDDTLDEASEKIYLDIPYDNTCCHTAGGMAFDNKGNLYIATGDNTNASFTTYSPTDDEAGFHFDDALRSAGNTNDYRGKILRIHPEPDGTYTIPKGNLFPGKSDSTKPEIYIMGDRNPYRIAIDPLTDDLYWGEVGPDGEKDSTWGPMGYDEFNHAHAAGNFGWPLFIGDNKAYHRIYFGDHDSVGPVSDPSHPINFSRNNSGKKILPPAQPAMIWYPYDSSRNFPSFGSGGRVAIGGPIYHYQKGLKSKVKFPASFDHCWFIGEWMRNWIKVVHLDHSGDPAPIDDFMPHSLFRKPIYMAFGKDGALYVLEWGSSWRNNADAQLDKIEYISGNLAPVAHMTLDKAFGETPLSVHFSAAQSVDYDGDSLRYWWLDEKGDTLASGKHASITFDKPGRYPIKLKVLDAHGAASFRDTVVWAGNALPSVQLAVSNRTFYWDSLHYQVSVSDQEDGIPGKGIPYDSVKVTLRYLPGGASFASTDARLRSEGQVLLGQSDCKGCHQLDSFSVGPSFRMIARKYYKDTKFIPVLANKILKGGTGVWGTASMSPHPQLNIDQTTAIVRYIYSLADANHTRRIPMESTIALAPAKSLDDHYVLQASYTDRGNPPVGSLSQTRTVILKNPRIPASAFDAVFNAKIDQGNLVGIHNSSGMIRRIDLTGVRQILVSGMGGGAIVVRLDAPDGPVAGRAVFNGRTGWVVMAVDGIHVTGVHDLYFIFENLASRFSGNLINWVQFNRTAISTRGLK